MMIRELAKVTDGSAVSISGTWTRCPPGKKQTHELAVSDVKVLGASDPAVRYPPHVARRIMTSVGYAVC